MRTQGATVVAVKENQSGLNAYRAKSGVPESAASCHTANVEGYVVEGHVPAEAIKKLLAERPDAVGLALPGMPIDAPGMGGDASTWARQEVLLVGRDGQLTRFPY